MSSSFIIQLHGVKKTLGGQPVLQGVDLGIPIGDITTIIGPSGEGKSVLLKHMIGLMRPDQGQVVVDEAEANGFQNSTIDIFPFNS